MQWDKGAEVLRVPHCGYELVLVEELRGGDRVYLMRRGVVLDSVCVPRGVEYLERYRQTCRSGVFLLLSEGERLEEALVEYRREGREHESD